MVDDVYDELTRRRIDRVLGQRPRASRPRQALGGGALLTAVALGLQDVFDPRHEEPVVEEVDAELAGDDEPVVLALVWGFPARSRALVRPWLL